MLLPKKLPLAMAIVAAALAARIGAADDPRAVRVYTNADLEDLPEAPAGIAPPADDGWEFVQEHLDREYARLDAEHAYDLARADPCPVHEAHAIVGSPYWPFRNGYSGAAGRHMRPHGLTAGADPVARPRPLHAGPTPTERFRARALENRGSDAWPR